MTAAPPNPLAELEPAVARLLDRHLATAKEWFPHDYVPWDLGRSFTDAPWEAADSGLSAVARIALDENLHYAFYRDVACAAIELDPSAMVLAMKRQVLGFAMPGFELRGFRERAITIAAAGIYDLRIHHDQVLCPVLLRHWRLRELRGLSDEAERAREAVLTFLESLGGASASVDEHQAAAPANACG